MNNSEIGAAFVAMCNGTKEVKQIIGRNHLHIYHNYLGGVSLYSYATPIAVYDGKKVVLNRSFFSASTAKHQNTISGKRFNCPVAYVYNFARWGCSDSDLIEQAAPLYGFRRVELTASNGRKYTRFELFKQIDLNRDNTIELHRYTTEQAAKDEAARLNSLAYSWSVQQ